MNEKDIRVVKTRESIEAALLELLKSKPIDKISVVELACTAKINKSTFYLHYQDIHDLYRQTLFKILEKPFRNGDFFPDFFSDPEHFFAQLGDAIRLNLPAIFAFTHNQDELQVVRDLISVLCRKVYETGIIEKNVENDMKLEAIFWATLMIMPEYYENYSDLGHKRLADMARALFPG